MGMARRILTYGAALAAAAVLLATVEYQRLVRPAAGDMALFVIAAGFLALGVWIGARVLGHPVPRAPGNPAAQAGLGISARERRVLDLLAAGQSNKEIARTLGISPNTVKTHVARLYEKLGAKRRTDAVARARGLGLID